MSLKVTVNGQELQSILSGPPKITDQMDSACRTLELPMQATYADDLALYVGQPLELWYYGRRWFYGIVWKRRYSDTGAVSLLVYDPMIYFKKHKGDFYFKNQTYTQVLQQLAERIGVWAGSMESTKTVFPQLFYQNTTGDKVAADALTKTVQETGKKFWFRFNPYVENFGLSLFERKAPTELWAFQQGVNMTSATYEESLEDTYTVVEMINRETGKIVRKVDVDGLLSFGQMVDFIEVNKDNAATMEQDAQTRLDQVSQVAVTMSVEGVNPNGVIPQLFSGDMVYVEEEFTQLIGAYYVYNVTQEIVSDKLVKINMDVRLNLDVPTIKYKKNATKDPSAKKGRGKKKGKGIQETPQYSDAVKAVMDKYGIK